ncbi:ABC transporter permease [Herbiconiux sp. A18JL235]|uniref:Autoinducer 2 import system permease protein LsrC n=1 Tax=Herbiconiux sp. A18JL235 TaxID=3152363 RepID=A0AB39BIS0_9MICO
MTDQTAVATAPRRTPLADRFGGLRELVLLPVIILVMIIGSILTPNFFTVNNLVNKVLVTSAVLGVVVIAESMILIAGYFDLSLESTVGLAPMLAAWLVLPAAVGGSGLGLSPWAAFGVMFVASIAIGLFNGFLIAVLRLNAFIVTLAMLIFLRGLTLGISGGQTLSGLPPEFTALGNSYIFGISVQVWIVVVAFVVVALFMRKHPVGRKIYAIGGNEEASKAAGINTVRITIGLFVVGAMLAALAGLMLTSRIASVTANQGDGMIFTVFAAAVIGGISLDGGRGTMVGAATGVLLLGIIQNILTLTNVPSFWISAIYGLIILAALVFGHFSGRLNLLRSAKLGRA